MNYAVLMIFAGLLSAAAHPVCAAENTMAACSPAERAGAVPGYIDERLDQLEAGVIQIIAHQEQILKNQEKLSEEHKQLRYRIHRA